MIVITGASSGIGKACAEALASTKYASQGMTLLARRKERLESLQDALQSRYPSLEIKIFDWDISDVETLQRGLRENEAWFSRTTCLINNAGLAKGMTTFHESSWEDTRIMIDTNITGLFCITRNLVPALLKHTNRRESPPHIVQIGSVAGRWVYPKGTVYCATKAAVKAFNEGLRMDLLGTGIRVTTIDPGMVETEFSQVRLGDSQAAKAVYEGMRPLTPQDIAKSVAWVLDQPSHVNIQEIVLYPTDQAAPGQVHRSPPFPGGSP